MPPLISLVGKANSGKTTLLEKLIPILSSRGCRVGTIKHHHRQELEMDRPGKDTWRHKQAGAAVVALVSPAGIGVVRETQQEMEPEEVADRFFQDVDLVITEGYKRGSAPKVELFRSTEHGTPLEERDHTWVAMVTDQPAAAGNLPCFGLDRIEPLADFLIAAFVAQPVK